jgi:ribonuclease HII
MTGLTDSKKMTEKARERIVAEARKMMSAGELRFGVFSAPASRIDDGGIERAIRALIRQGLSRLAPDSDSFEVFLDGRLSAPEAYRQETVIRGDALVPVISLASVVAKVARDRYMTRVMHPKFPEYGFAEHKGYGTARHIAAIRAHGPSEIHRMSFLRNVLTTQ